MCECASISAGITVLPERSTRTALGGATASPWRPTRMKRPSCTRKAERSIGAPPSPAISLAPSYRTGADGGGACAAAPARNAATTTGSSTRVELIRSTSSRERTRFYATFYQVPLRVSIARRVTREVLHSSMVDKSDVPPEALMKRGTWKPAKGSSLISHWLPRLALGWLTASTARSARVLLAVAAIAGLSMLLNAQQPRADIVLTNGKVITVDEKFSIAQAVAIAGDRILAVGTTQQINALAGPSTRRIDLRGRALMPGFIDNHAHYQEEGAYWTLEDRLDGIETRKQALETLRARAKQKGPGQWIFTLGGWSPDQFTDDSKPFTRDELDKALPDNPVFLQFSR